MPGLSPISQDLPRIDKRKKGAKKVTEGLFFNPSVTFIPVTFIPVTFIPVTFIPVTFIPRHLYSPAAQVPPRHRGQGPIQSAAALFR